MGNVQIELDETEGYSNTNYVIICLSRITKYSYSIYRIGYRMILRATGERGEDPLDIKHVQLTSSRVIVRWS